MLLPQSQLQHRQTRRGSQDLQCIPSPTRASVWGWMEVSTEVRWSRRGGLTKAGKSRLVGGEAHPAEYGLAGGAGALGQGAYVQGAPSVQSSQVGPRMGVRKAGTSGSTHASLFPALGWPLEAQGCGSPVEPTNPYWEVREGFPEEVMPELRLKG